LENHDSDIQRELDKIEARKKKANRLWYQKKRFIIPLVLVSIFFIDLITESSETESPNEETDEIQTPAPIGNLSQETNESAESKVEEVEVSSWPFFEPMSIAGEGDDVVLVEQLPNVFAIEVTGNEEDRFFAVRALDSSGERIDSLVSTTRPYEGISLYWEDEVPSAIEIAAQGSWSIRLIPIELLEQKPIGAGLTGSGDYVYRITEIDGLEIIAIDGNAESRFFAARAYDRDSKRDSLVSTTEPYSGRVRISPSAVLLQIEAVGDWTINP
jgi:hypothetical protein